MTVSKHFQHVHRRKNEYDHPYRAPEEEEDLAHIHLTLRFVLLVFGMVPVSTYLIAIWVAAHPHVTEVKMNPNYTQYVMDTFQFNETGNGEIWVYNEDGTKKNLGQFWNKLYFFERSHYAFGSGNISMCYNRNAIYEHDWSTSIFRATQLYSSVQTGMRYGVLIMMLPMIFTAYIIAKTLFMEQKTLGSAIIGAAYVCNEILFYLALFLLTALHVVFDEKYLKYNTIYFSVTVFLSITKLILRNFTENAGLPTVLRTIGVFIFFFAHSPLELDIQDYAEHVYCDTFAPPRVCVLQLLCIGTLFFANLYDVQRTRFFKLVISSTVDDVAIQRWPRKSVFRRFNVLETY